MAGQLTPVEPQQACSQLSTGFRSLPNSICAASFSHIFLLRSEETKAFPRLAFDAFCLDLCDGVLPHLVATRQPDATRGHAGNS
jgi:hypothetical protein